MSSHFAESTKRVQCWRKTRIVILGILQHAFSGEEAMQWQKGCVFCSSSVRMWSIAKSPTEQEERQHQRLECDHCTDQSGWKFVAWQHVQSGKWYFRTHDGISLTPQDKDHHQTDKPSIWKIQTANGVVLFQHSSENTHPRVLSQTSTSSCVMIALRWSCWKDCAMNWDTLVCGKPRENTKFTHGRKPSTMQDRKQPSWL